MKTITRRAALLGAGALVGGAISKMATGLVPTLAGTRSTAPAGVVGTLNDASGLNETPIFRHVMLSEGSQEQVVSAVRTELAEARVAGRPVNVGAARHSMGGQAIARDGHALTFDSDRVEIDTSARVMRVHGGARWRDVIARADREGLGPAVMQSNNDFGVAATFCVNAHGWPVKKGPMGSTVQSFDMVMPDGALVTCSRSENADLFNLTMGGYGLTGVITQMDVDLSPNQRLDPSFEEMSAEVFGVAFMQALEDPDVCMAYGRLNVDRADFMTQALLVTYRSSADQSDLPPAQGSGVAARLASRIYRAQLGNEPLKRLRWWFETEVATALGGGGVTRNSLINEPVATLDDRDPGRTDILHEYFVPPAQFAAFVDMCRAIIPASYQEFLNVTLRFVDTDPSSVLAYAATPRIAAVMSFSQEMTARAEADMQRMTAELIDGILGIGGTYYLPYRLHARQDQFRAAYPRAAEFAQAKRALDPAGVMRNGLWEHYLERI